MRLIDADVLIDRLDYCVKEGMGSTIAFTFKHMVDDAPTIEPKRGEWITHEDKCGVDEECSACNNRTMFKYDFCPHCGADMREREGE